MAWFKTDDTFGNHPKVKAAGRAAIGLWAVCGPYSSAYKLDGFVPDAEVATASDRKLADKLVQVGLWHRSEDDCDCRLTEKRTGGWYFHDWGDYQPTADEIEKDRDRARDRQRRSRERKRKREAGESDTPT